MGDTSYEYAGEELANFSIVVNWKTYWSSTILPYLGKYILEVGAGIGSSTKILSSMSSAETWLCLEPDPGNIEILKNEKRAGDIPAYCEFRQGGLTALRENDHFDSILYIDVLEHIEDDEKEILLASEHLLENGHLIILAPAYPFLFSEFDKAIGHYRRYSRGMFADNYADSLHRVSIRYLDSVGLLTSLGNRFLLRSSLPTKEQLAFWDRYLIPLSRVTDWIVRYRFGRSILAIYQKVP
jgi:2-polyprenyl-3-methyl-5-hydroxy-6-metoxy-1,4-benzoquinol methylase